MSDSSSKTAEQEVDADGTERRKDDPAEVYSHRLQGLQKLQTTEQQRERRLGYAKLTLGLLTIALAVLFLHRPISLSLLSVPVAAFVLLLVPHEKVLKSLRHRARAIRFYEAGMARLDGSWPGSGETGERFLDPSHPYARDLDLFGKASLFELLCTARTRAGEEVLAKWLLESAPLDEILGRQDAIRNLQGHIQFRERLFSLGETVRLGVQPEALSAWGKRAPVLRSKSIRVATSALAVLWIWSLVCWGVWAWHTFALLMTILNLGYSHLLHSRLEESADAIEKASTDLKLLAEVLQLMEQERFLSPKLQELQAALKVDEIAPSAAIGKLSRIVDWLESRRNLFVRFIDLFTFWSAQFVFLAEDWQKRFGPAIRGWLRAVGELEALIALSGYAYEHPEDVFPDFVAKGPLFDAAGFAHPLLPGNSAVRNDLKLGDSLQAMILSGPNMAGKSTFIRSIGVNVVLAQCGAPVRAHRLTLSPVAVAASICVLDSLNGGVSRFYAEIRRIKTISDLAQGPVPVLFLLDELLSGTNSHDRLLGTQYVVRSLLKQGAIGIVSTHDLALTEIPDSTGGRAINCHFEDQLGNGELIFDYKLKPGIVQTSNALELMRSIGLEVTG